MSRSSGYGVGKKSRHGTQTERQRVRTHHIMATQTAKLAALVAKNVKEQIVEAVKDELDRRGYEEKPGYHDVADLYEDAGSGDQPDSGPPSSVPKESSEQADPETPEPMEEA